MIPLPALEAEPATPPAIEAPAAGRGLLLPLLICWAIGIAALVYANWGAILHRHFPDPDDQMRLVEVRDWLAGQSWWDVSQHRMNLPFGGPMHWSRLVDLPIAGAELFFRLFLAPVAAETAAAVVVPMVTMGTAMSLTALVTRRLVDREAALLAALLSVASIGVLQQMQPMRVDHHGWQIALAMAVLLALLDVRPLRSGLVTGALLALWLRISLEGLPLAALAGAIVALRWALVGGRGEGARFIAFFAALTAGSLALLGLLIPRSGWGTVWCDSLSAPHIAVFATGLAGSMLLVAIGRGPAVRFGGLALLGGLCLAVLRSAAPRCGLDPFADLEPVVRTIWYDNVLEGLPLWRQSATVVVMAIGYPLIGFAAAAAAWRIERDRRTEWTLYLALLGGTMLATLMVQRIGGTANLLAIPGATWLVIRLLRRSRRQTGLLARVFGAALAILLFAPPTPGLVATAIGAARKDKTAQPDAAELGATCETGATLDALRAIAPANLLAPLDISPGILLETRNSVVATNHHRNHVALADVISAFVGDDATARRILIRRHIDYVVLCRGAAELNVYTHYAPHGFAARLAHGDAPAWLSPVAMPPGPLRVWRVRSPAQPAKLF